VSDAVLQGGRAPALPARRGGSSRAVLLWLLALPFLAGLVFIVFFALSGGGDKTAVLALAAFTGIFCLVPVILDRARPTTHRHLMLSLFGLGYLVFMVAPVFTLYLFQEIEEVRGGVAVQQVLPPDVVRGQIAALTALLCFLLGYALPLGRAVGRALPSPRRQWSASSTIVVGLGLIGLGWAVYLGNQFGLIPERAGSGVLGAIMGSTIFGIALLNLAYLCLRSRVALLIMVLLIPPTMFFNYFTGSKTMFLAPAAMIGYAWLVVRRRIPVLWILAGTLLIALYYPVAQFQRDVILKGLTLSAADVIGDPGRVLSETSRFASSFDFAEYLGEGIRMTSGRLEGLGVLSVIVRDTPGKVPFQGGWTLGYIALSYVPRALWPGKPVITIGQWITDHYGPGPTIVSNTGPTWMGELYLNFGYPGLAIGMMLLGIYLRILHEMFFRPDATVPALLIGALAIFCTIPTLQGGLLGPINGVIYLATPFLLMHGAICLLTSPPRPPRALAPPGLAQGTRAGS
jgi:hypothetical protein